MRTGGACACTRGKGTLWNNFIFLARSLFLARCRLSSKMGGLFGSSNAYTDRIQSNGGRGAEPSTMNTHFESMTMNLVRARVRVGEGWFFKKKKKKPSKIFLFRVPVSFIFGNGRQRSPA